MSHELLFASLFGTIFTSDLGKFGFADHTQVNNLSQVVLVTLLNLIDFLPSAIFDVFSLSFVLLEQLFNFLLKFLNLSILLFLCKSILNLEIFKLFLLKQVELRDFVTEIVALLFLESDQLGIPLLISRFLNTEFFILQVDFLTVQFIQKVKSFFILLLF